MFPSGKCSSLLYEKKIVLTNIATQLPPIFENFWKQDKMRVCKNCNTYLEKSYQIPLIDEVGFYNSEWCHWKSPLFLKSHL